MAKIETIDFESRAIERLKDRPLGLDWPTVYFLQNDKSAYIGQTTGLYDRTKTHKRDARRALLKKVHIITDEEFNMSAAYDIEALLIQYIAAEGTYKIQNGNRGLTDHNYFDKPRYRAKFELVWDNLKSLSLVKRELNEVKNSELFKYSPYKALTPEQLAIAEELITVVASAPRGTHIVQGGPGTGKSVLATYLIKAIKDNKETKGLRVALVVSMTPLRDTLKKVFSHVEGLSSNMVIGPSEVAKNEYDLLVVDEAHRLRQRRGLTGYGAHDKINILLGFDKYTGTELDWILKQSKHQILFYDENQTIRPADVPATRFESLDATHHHLTAQLRVEGGQKYLKLIEQLFTGEQSVENDLENYEFKMYEDVGEMVQDIKIKNEQVGLARVVAGYAWPWISKKNPDAFDIEIGETKLKWNSQLTDWVNSANAINEVGCIHTVQGYDLNYVGVIIGSELTYDEVSKKLRVNPKNYKDVKGIGGVVDDSELERYILNIYKTMLTRGIKGTYVYVVDEKLKNHFNDLISVNPINKERVGIRAVLSPITREMLRVPLVGSAPCGAPLLGNENIEEYIAVEKSKIKPGYKYFILRADGDSMNLAGINDGDLVLCRQQLKADTGDRVVALLGENVTIKEYGPREDGIRLLLPKSSNKIHMPITPGEGDSVQGIVQEVLESEN